MDNILHEALKKEIKRHGDEMQFFQMCYYRMIGKHHNCVSDVCQYILHSIVPKYVENYLNMMEQDDGLGF